MLIFFNFLFFILLPSVLTQIRQDHSQTELRFLLSQSHTTNSTALIVTMPNCTSNEDCSEKGTCNLATGICICDVEYSTYVDPKIIENISLNTPVLMSNSFIESNSTFTEYFKVIELTRSDIQMCNYQKKKQLTALMLSLFVSFGAEHFYLERYKSAAAKIVFTVACCGVNIVFFIFYKCVKDGKKYIDFIDSFQALYLSCGFLFMILWTVYDCVNIGFNKFTDGNGIPMLTWNEAR